VVRVEDRVAMGGLDGDDRTRMEATGGSNVLRMYWRTYGLGGKPSGIDGQVVRRAYDLAYEHGAGIRIQYCRGAPVQRRSVFIQTSEQEMYYMNSKRSARSRTDQPYPYRFQCTYLSEEPSSSVSCTRSDL
jgi:hypothetical protein